MVRGRKAPPPDQGSFIDIGDVTVTVPPKIGAKVMVGIDRTTGEVKATPGLGEKIDWLTYDGPGYPVPMPLPGGDKYLPIDKYATIDAKVVYDAKGRRYTNIRNIKADSMIVMQNGVMIETFGERFFAPTGSLTMTFQTSAGKLTKTIDSHMAGQPTVSATVFAGGVPSGLMPADPAKNSSAKGTKVPKPNEIDCWTLAEAVAAIAARLLLYGPPGTGKSFGAARMGLRAGQEPVIITCTEDMSAIQLIGHFIPKGNEMVWMDGPIIKAWREGTRLVINEIDRASGDALTFFLGALDDPATASMTLPNDTHELVRPKRGFTVVATMNGEPDTDLPAPLRDRFASAININQVHPAAIEALPADLRHAAKTSALVVDETRRISVRKWNEFAFLRDAFIQKHGEELGVNMAAAAVFGARANEAINAIRINKVGA